MLRVCFRVLNGRRRVNPYESTKFQLLKLHLLGFGSALFKGRLGEVFSSVNPNLVSSPGRVVVLCNRAQLLTDTLSSFRSRNGYHKTARDAILQGNYSVCVTSGSYATRKLGSCDPESKCAVV